MKFAVIETGGKQYKVSAGQKLKVEKLETEIGEQFAFDKVLLVSEEHKDSADATIGAPYVAGVKVQATVVSKDRDPKKIVFRYHNKNRYRKFKTHRQDYTEVEINSIG
jgi:large subunit ribosomal protein L21